MGAPARHSHHNTTTGGSISTLLTINAAADINEDESVSFDDLVILAENWLADISFTYRTIIIHDRSQYTRAQSQIL